MRNLVSGALSTLVLVSGVAAQQPSSCPDTATDSSRIAVAGGSVTEILYFLGEEQRIVGVDITSNYPDEASNHPNLGYVRALSSEGLLSTNPSLILGEDDMGPGDVLAQVAATGVEILHIPEETNEAGIIEKVRCVSQVLGIEEQVKPTIDTNLRSAVEELSELRKDQGPKHLAFLITAQGGSATAGGSDTSAAGFMAMLGGTNVFEEFSGWKPVSVEAIVEADPDYILISERGIRGLGGLEQAKSLSVLGMTRAVQDDRLIVIDGMAALGFGPRTLFTAVETLKEFARDQ